MPNDVIDRVHNMAHRAAANQALIFEDRAHNEINDIDNDNPEDDDNDIYDNDYDPDDDDNNDDHDDDDDDDDGINHPHDINIAGVNQASNNNNNNHAFDNEDNDEATNDTYDDDDNNDNDDDNANQPFDNDDTANNHPEIHTEVETEMEYDANEPEEINNESNSDDDGADKPDIEQIMDNTYGPRNNRYNMGPRKPRDYSHRHVELEDTIMTQFNAKQGIKQFGEAGVALIIKALQQLHDRKVMEPKNRSDLTEDITEALEYLMFVSEKRDGTIKGRGCADGRKQRATTTKKKQAPRQWQLNRSCYPV